MSLHALLVVEVMVTAMHVAAASLPPNFFIGKCLTSSWVNDMEASLGISSTDRDSFGRLVNPFLKPALASSRYTVRNFV